MTVNENRCASSYEIVIENGTLGKIASHLNLKRKVMIVSDSGVPEQYVKAVANECLKPHVFVFPQGENSKNIKVLESILSAMIQHKFTRGDCVVAVGGGVVGDIGGFAASCYMRGIDFYNIPTTLLSQVDSSIGGKTAINYGEIKNSIGAFYMPKKVVIDPSLLETLDKRQLNSGFAEVIKMAATSDAALFELLEKTEAGIPLVKQVIEPALHIKREIVENDPFETGLRKVLNFGHTVGHAIEALSFGKLYHGECVALGMLTVCSPEVKERLLKLYRKFGLPTKTDCRGEDVVNMICLDKKNTADGVITVWVDTVGSYEFRTIKAEEFAVLTEAIYEEHLWK